MSRLEKASQYFDYIYEDGARRSQENHLHRRLDGWLDSSN